MSTDFSFTVLKNDCNEFGLVNEWVISQLIYKKYNELFKGTNNHRLTHSEFKFISPIQQDQILYFKMEKIENNKNITLKTCVYDSNNDLMFTDNSLFLID